MNNQNVPDEVVDVIGNVCDAALKGKGLSVINDVNKLLNWVSQTNKPEVKKDES